MTISLSRPLLRVGLLVAAGLTVTGLTSCSSAPQAAEDAYAIGCPALDTALAGGSVANRAAVRGLEALRDSGQLDPDPAAWVDAAISTLQSADPDEIPAETRALLVQGCADHGYELQNL
jgi:hypothetical protein